MTPKEAVDFAKKNNAKIVDMKFMDLLGSWQHFSVPMCELEEHLFEEGLGFDGSSIRGWQAINNSDMLVIPDPATTVIDPFMKDVTVSMICNIVDPITREKYSRDPRNIAQKAEAYLKSTGIGDTAYFGPEAEFFVFDNVQYDSSANESFYSIDSVEAKWNTGRDEDPNLGHKPRHKEGYFPVAPTDTLQDIRSEMMLLMEQVGITMECHHHEVATGGQCEIDIMYDHMTNAADAAQSYKYVIKNVAQKYGKVATCMPKPIAMDAGSGMHVNVSLWKGKENAFYDPDDEIELSQAGRYFCGGIINHAKALSAICNPTTNSYHRLVPGYEAPAYIAWSAGNRSAIVRVPKHLKGKQYSKLKRLEFRAPDPSSNPYLVFAAVTAAGMDGIKKKMDPGEQIRDDIFKMTKSDRAKRGIGVLPKSLGEALDELESDRKFLNPIYTNDVIDKIIELERRDQREIAIRPHPHEFYLYFDV